MSKLSDLLNPLPASRPASRGPSISSPPRREAQTSIRETTFVDATATAASRQFSATSNLRPGVQREEIQSRESDAKINATWNIQGRPARGEAEGRARVAEEQPILGVPAAAKLFPPPEPAQQSQSPTLTRSDSDCRAPIARQGELPRLAPLQTTPEQTQMQTQTATTQVMDGIETPARDTITSIQDSNPVAVVQPSHHDKGDSPQPIKQEPAGGSQEPSRQPTPSSLQHPVPSGAVTPVVAAATRSPAPATLKRATSEASPGPNEVTSSTTSKKPPAKKKQPPSKSGTAKTGTAAAQNLTQSKKRKLDQESKATATSALKRSETPSSRASKTPAGHSVAKSSTPAQGHTSSPAPGAGEEYEDGTDLFCICRRPDNHTWMIGCDGGCEDWFHGSCVKIKEEDGDLIDKYICPKCEIAGKGNTTWKPMCRCPGCRQPARLAKSNASKYCSDEHGREFMRLQVERGSKRKLGGGGGNKKDTKQEADVTFGGPLSSAQLSALVSESSDLDTFKRLGEGIPSPPPTASPDEGDDNKKSTDNGFDDEEGARLSDLQAERSRLEQKSLDLKDREKFVQLVRARAKRILEGMKGVKDICGYDGRLTMSDEEFTIWRDSPEGHEALHSGTLGPPPRQTNKPDTTHTNPDAMIVDGEDVADDDAARGVCQKKRCERHRQWWTLQLQDLRSEEDSVAELTALLNRREKDLKDRAKLRRIKNAEGDREGYVEVVNS